MSFGLEINLRQKLETRLRLTQEQRLKIEEQLFSLRLQLVGELRSEQYQPTTSCPRCGGKITPNDIIKGFNDNPNDYTTGCPVCHHRFEPRLICFGNGSTIEIPLYCAVQTLPHLRGKQEMSPDEFKEKHPGIYRSAIIHYGSIKNAFEKIGVQYDFKEIDSWKDKILPFLGRMPDTVIASCVNISAKIIGSMRRKMGISRYTLRKALDE